jgi:hypothetical protein
MFFSIEVAILIVIQISILALLGKRFSIRMNVSSPQLCVT